MAWSKLGVVTVCPQSGGRGQQMLMLGSLSKTQAKEMRTPNFRVVLPVKLTWPR